jgi:hypothetical protein
MAQQTAVEWFYNKLIVYMNGDGDFESAQQIYKQAKEMEKEQMHKCASFWRGKENEIEKPIFDLYYNETYKK